MAIISSNEYLTLEQGKDNAQFIMNYFTNKGWSKNAICGMLGNMQRESTMNPGLWESLDYGNYSGGYGLVQWTPATNFTNWASANGYSIGSITGQCARIIYELENGLQYYPSTDYSLSFSQYSVSTQTPEYLAAAFAYNYERAGVVALSERQQYARYWYNQLTSGFTFTPRLTDSGMQGSKYYYSENPFYLAGYGLPNCTCYAWGRRYEITGNPPTTSLGNADTWYDYNKTNGIYPYGQTPQLGAIMCFRYAEPYTSQGGHVAIVEEINGDDVVTSNSAYGGAYFYTQTLTKSSGYSWASHVIFQGFIYLTETPIEPEPEPEPTPTTKKKYPFYLYQKYYRW